jgi:hypothetical protein
MAYVEQVVFTSAETDRSAGYQVVARSPGVCEADARELAVWGPSHDSLLESGPEVASFNFHLLPSGAYCVSHTTQAGWEYSGRGGHRVYTQCLIVPRDVLARFANNPFALIRAAQAGGMLEVHEQVPSQLEPLLLAGRAAPVDQTLLARLAANPGPQKMAMFMQAALDSACLAVAGLPSAGQLIAGLFSCLPPQCRHEFSFSTGLKFSSRRPFRIVALSGDPAEQRWVAHQHNVSVLNVLESPPPAAVPIDGWAQLIGRVLASGRTSFLATQLSRRRPNLTPEDLPALGLQLLEDLEASALRDDHQQGKVAAEEDGAPVPLLRVVGAELCEAQTGDEEGDCSPFPPRRAHAAHGRLERRGDAVAMAQAAAVAPSTTLEPDSPEVVGKLEFLDDVVFEAIGGQTTAQEQLKTLWPQILEELGEELVAESREQYLRYALTIWEDSVDGDGIRNPSRAVQALDVLCILFDSGSTR